jgi:hydrogenase-4 membrane subunit HyfE
MNHHQPTSVPNAPVNYVKRLSPIFLIFIAVTVFALAAPDFLEKNNIDRQVLIYGNLILFTASLLVFYMYIKALKNKSAYGFVRNVYTGFMIKLLILVVAAMSYFYFSSEVNQPAIFICLGLYLVYHFVGTVQVAGKSRRTAGKPHHHK